MEKDASCSESEAEENDLLQPANGVKIVPILARSNLRVNSKYNNSEIEMSEYNWKKSDASPTGSLRRKFVFTVPGVMKQQQPREYKLKAFVVFLFFLIVIYISLTYVFHKQQELYILHTEIGEGVHFHEKSRVLRILNANRQNVLRGELDVTLDDHLMPYECSLPYGKHGRCFKWKNSARLVITYQLSPKTGGHPRNETSTRCYDVEWETSTSQIEDCFETNDAVWFGVGETKNCEWPLGINDKREMVAFVTGHGNDGYGSILDRYWLSSKGVSILVDKKSPLFVVTNEHQMCFLVKWGKPYRPTAKSEKLKLKYSICAGKNLKSVHRFVGKNLKEKKKESNETKEISSDAFDWLFWFNRNSSLNRQALMQFADEILELVEPTFHKNVIVIGEGWQKEDGDLKFDNFKFPNPNETVTTIHNKGFQLALSVHPYISTSSVNYLQQIDNNFWIRNEDKTAPALTRWKKLHSAAILDSTNQEAVSWFSNKLKSLNVDGFFFDGGQTSYLPSHFTLTNPQPNPDFLSANYFNFSLQSGQFLSISTASGTHSQNGFVHLSPRDSKWGHDRGLKSLIPLVLSVGLAGFPFINPGSVGGNSPEGELFIRWMQVSTFLPVLQFTSLPQQHGSGVLEIAKNLLKLRHQVVLPALRLALPDASRYGVPLIRPLWWADPNDATTLTIDDEFLVGDDLLVAPVLEESERFKDVYFPTGQWNDSFNNRVISGPKWVVRISVPLDRVLFFTRVKMEK